MRRTCDGSLPVRAWTCAVKPDNVAIPVWCANSQIVSPVNQWTTVTSAAPVAIVDVPECVSPAIAKMLSMREDISLSKSTAQCNAADGYAGCDRHRGFTVALACVCVCVCVFGCASIWICCMCRCTMLDCAWSAACYGVLCVHEPSVLMCLCACACAEVLACE